jgi:hypothetical protein
VSSAGEPDTSGRATPRLGIRQQDFGYRNKKVERHMFVTRLRFGRRFGAAVTAAFVAAASVVAVAGVVAHPAPAHASLGGHGGDFIALPPGSRALDTRTAYPSGLPAGSQGYVDFQVTNVPGMPSTVKAVMLAVTAVRPTGHISLYVYTKGEPLPSISTMNSPAASSTGNYNSSAVVAPDANGMLTLFNGSAVPANVVIDIQGFYTAGTGTPAHGGYQSMLGGPRKIADSRNGTGVPQAKVSSGGSLTIQVTSSPLGVGVPPPLGYIPPGTSTVYGELTVANNAASGSVTMHTTSEADTVYPSLGFQAGGSSTSMVVRLGSDGKVVVVNHSAQPIDFALSIGGYWATNPSYGSDIHLFPKRVATSALIAGSGSLSVPLGISNGYTNNHISDVLADITVINQTSTGALRVSGRIGSDDDVYTTPAQWHNSLVTISGTQSVTLQNLQSTAIRVYVDIEAYYTDDADTSVPVISGSTPQIIQGTSTSGVDAAYVDDSGQLMHGYTSGPSDLSTPTWSSVPGADGVTGPPSISKLPDGVHEEIAVQALSNGEILTAVVPIAQSWDTVQFTHTGGIMATPPTTANMPDGHVVTFASDSNCESWAFDNGTWSRINSHRIGPVYEGSSGWQCTPSQLPPLAVSGGGGIWVIPRDGFTEAGHYTGAGIAVSWSMWSGPGAPMTAVLDGSRVLLAYISGGAVTTELLNTDGSRGTAHPAPGPIGATFDGVPGLVPDSAHQGLITVVAHTSDGSLLTNAETTSGTGVLGADWGPTSWPPTRTDVGLTPFAGSSSWLGLYLGLSDGSQYLIQP